MLLFRLLNHYFRARYNGSSRLHVQSHHVWVTSIYFRVDWAEWNENVTILFYCYCS